MCRQVGHGHDPLKKKTERGNTAVAQEHWDVLLDETQSSNIHIAMSNCKGRKRERGKQGRLGKVALRDSV